MLEKIDLVPYDKLKPKPGEDVVVTIASEQYVDSSHKTGTSRMFWILEHLCWKIFEIGGTVWSERYQRAHRRI